MIDNGDGIVVEYINCLMECFYCVDKVCSCIIGGFGLGLVIIKYVFICYDSCLDICS